MGTITLSYSGSPGGNAMTLSANATISDADAATLIAWATQTPPPRILWNGAQLTGPQDSFAAIAAWIAGLLTAEVGDWQRQTAAQAASASVTGISIQAGP